MGVNGGILVAIMNHSQMKEALISVGFEGKKRWSSSSDPKSV